MNRGGLPSAGLFVKRTLRPDEDLSLHFKIALQRPTRGLTCRAGRRTMRYRSGLNAVRSSDAKSAGSSHAAKCPPRSTSLK